MRRYEIRPADDGFTLVCRADPPETMPGGWTEAAFLFGLTESEAHRAGLFMRQNEAVHLSLLYEATERHIGREPYTGRRK